MKRGAEKKVDTKQGIQTTQWQIKETKKKVNQINRERKAEREKANVSTQKGTMGSIEANMLLDKSFNPDKIKKRDWKKFVANVEKQTRGTYSEEKADKYKEHYLNAINEHLWDIEEGKILYEFIRKYIPPELLYDIFYDDPLLQIGYISDPIPAYEIAQNMLEHLKQLILNYKIDVTKEDSEILDEIELEYGELTEEEENLFN